MCCTSNNPSQQPPFRGNRWGGYTPVCECGCIGRDRSILDLQHYKDHLEAELKSVDRQIKDLQGSEA